ncbi:MAG: glycosyltransferase [Rhodobiaceae bacterium]|nr:glycosyltransferase [Rhodobiaceae bacterium]MCC0055987.1 glycosyltransferase [Rhodobiaceae bacterium]
MEASVAGRSKVDPPAGQITRTVIIVPVYEDRPAARHLFSQIAASPHRSAHVVAVEDGSLVEPLTPGDIAAAGLSGEVIRLKRNVGHQQAIAVGLCHAAEAYPDATCIVMDSDGEDPPEAIARMIEPLARNDVDAVVAQRRRRVASFSFRLFYSTYRMLFAVLTGEVVNFGNFMALKPVAVKRLAARPELPIHIAATLLISELRTERVPVNRAPRFVGVSRMNFSALVLHGFRALMVFAERVLIRVGMACAVIAALTVIGIIASVLLKSVGWATPGWFSVALGILFLTLLQTGTLTLISLLFTGILRGGSLAPFRYRDLIDEIKRT